MRKSKSPDVTSVDEIASRVQRLSTLLTKERDRLPAAYLNDPGLRRAYRDYFLPANLGKIFLPLRELDLHPGRLLRKERLRILDIGSGPGTAILGALEYFARHAGSPLLECTATDPVAGNLREAEALFSLRKDELGVRATLRTIKSGMEELASRIAGRYDIIILANIVNELYCGERERRIERRVDALHRLLKSLLADDGSCIIIEPALRSTSRDLLLVRDGLRDGGLHIYAPCLPHDRCPALANPRDWCHEDLPWDPPELIRAVDRRIGLRKDSLKFSYLVVRSDRSSLSDVFEDALRVVSDPLISKGKRECWVCGPGGRRLAMRLDKDRSPSNESFDQAVRGSVFRLIGAADEPNRIRVGKTTEVTILSRSRIAGEW